MPQIVVIKPFAFAHHGYQVEQFDPSPEPRETSDECAEIAVREGWASLCASNGLDGEATPRRRTKVSQS